MRRLSHRLSLLALPLFAACGGPELLPYEQAPGRLAAQSVGRRSDGLTQAAGCDGLLEQLRARERGILTASIQANRDYALRIVKDRDASCYDPEDDGCFFFCDGGGIAVAASDADRSFAPKMEGGGASSYTTTNNQVAGVDEPDFIKNDASTIYLVTEGEMHVVDAWPAADAHILESIDIPGRPQKMLLAGDRLVVFSGEGEADACGGAEWQWFESAPIDTEATSIRIYDVADPAHPVLERHIKISGALVNARQIGDAIHAVIGFGGLAQSGIPVWPEDLTRDLCNADVGAKKVRKAFDRLLARLEDRLAETTLVDFVPGVRDVDHSGSSIVSTREDLFAACEDFHLQPGSEMLGTLSVISLSAADDASFGATHVVGRSGEVYASAESLYVAVDEFDAVDEWGGQSGEHTKIHKFALGAGGAPAVYLGSGSVPGRIVNQFAMDEHAGHLRIATTEWGWPRTNSLFVLGEDGSGSLSITGQVTGIAPNEDIRSVRFAGDRGFVVTFQQTDPLFTFDLSDPTSPRILGELIIPGFSTYMHFLDDDHLLTIGFDTQGAWFQGVMLQIFDVTDMWAPRLAHKEVIGTRGSSSDATANHLAFTWYAERNLLAIPIGICGGGGPFGNYGDDLEFSGLKIYRVSSATGFDEVGAVSHLDGNTTGIDCSTWWESPDSQVKRSIFMEDYVYSLSSGMLKVNHLDALEWDLATFELPPLPEEPVCQPQMMSRPMPID